MKQLLLLIIATFICYGDAFAQRGDGHQRMTVEERLSNLKKDLNLTNEQAEKISELYTAFSNKVDKSRPDARENIRDEREKLNKQIEDLLTEEQKEIFHKIRMKGRNGQRKNFKGH